MEPEDGGYATTDEELDSDDDGGLELDLKMWLNQLDSPGTTASSTMTKTLTLKSKTSPAVTGSTASKTGKLEQPQEIDFDSILGQLSCLDEQFNDFNDTESSFPKPSPPKPPPAVIPKTQATHSSAAASGKSKITDDFGDINSQLMDAIFELNQLVEDDSSAKNKTERHSIEVKKAAVPPVASTQPVADVSQQHVPPVPQFSPSAQLKKEPVLNEAKRLPPPKFNSMKPPNAVRTSATSGVVNKEETVSLKSNDSGSSSMSLTQSVNSPRSSGRVSSAENLPQVCLKVFSPDGSSKSVLVDESVTVGRLCEILIEKNLVNRNQTWGIAELIPDLLMRRFLEDHQLILEEIRGWPKETNNQLVFLEMPKKYDMFDKSQVLDESRWDPSGLEGWLHVKSEGKKAWKKWNCVLQNGGIFYKAKAKSELSCLQSLKDVEIYTGVAWKKKFKAPTEFGFAFKPTATYRKSADEIKYLCADDQSTMWKWVTAIRVAKFGLQLYRNFRQSLHLPENESSPSGCHKTPAASTDRPDLLNRSSALVMPSRVSNLSEDIAVLSEFDSCSNAQRRGSNDSSRSGSISETIPSGSKIKAQIPITAQTARLLSMQSSSVQTLPRSTNRRSSQKVVSSGGVHDGRIYAEPSPMAVYHQTGLENYSARLRPDSPDLPPPPPELLSAPAERLPSPPTPGKGPPTRKSGPPAPPRRDEATKLSFKAKGNNVVQTKNFILNLQRAIGQKCQRGAEGIGQLEMPLPPPPVYSDEPSYLDLGDLPPPPAELLEELKVMRRKSKPPPTTPIKYGTVRVSKMH